MNMLQDAINDFAFRTCVRWFDRDIDNDYGNGRDRDFVEFADGGG